MHLPTAQVLRIFFGGFRRQSAACDTKNVQHAEHIFIKSVHCIEQFYVFCACIDAKCLVYRTK